jgi:hypothetical protein
VPTAVQQDINALQQDVAALRRRIRALEDLQIESKLRQCDAEFTRLRGVEDQTNAFKTEAIARIAALEAALDGLDPTVVA